MTLVNEWHRKIPKTNFQQRWQMWLNHWILSGLRWACCHRQRRCCEIYARVPIKRAMGGQAPRRGVGHINDQASIKGMSHEVHWMSLIINHNCLKLTQWRDHTGEPRRNLRRSSFPFMSVTAPDSGLYYTKTQLTFSELTSLNQLEKRQKIIVRALLATNNF